MHVYLRNGGQSCIGHTKAQYTINAIKISTIAFCYASKLSFCIVASHLNDILCACMCIYVYVCVFVFVCVFVCVYLFCIEAFPLERNKYLHAYTCTREAHKHTYMNVCAPNTHNHMNLYTHYTHTHMNLYTPYTHMNMSIYAPMPCTH